MKQEPTFLACGEALMDVFTPDPRVEGATTDARTGGSPFNVAIGLARLSQSVAYFGAISRDVWGTDLLRTLEGEGVDTSLVAFTAAPTTQSLVGVDASGIPTYEFRGEGAADRQLTLDDVERLPEVRAIHVGSYAMVVEPIATTLRTLVERRRHRTFIAWDPNVRPAVVDSVARWTTLYAWMLPRIHLLKLGLEDLAYLAPGQGAEQCATQAIEQGVALVVVTRGAQGASAWTRGVQVDVPATDVRVVDTVGAGDTIQAALLTWLAQHDRLEGRRAASLGEAELRDLLGFAVRAAGVTCSRRGAEMPRSADVG